MPALVTMSKGNNIRRIPSMKSVLEARKKPLEVKSADDLHINEEKIGLSASPTQVDKIFAPPAKTGGEIIDGSDPKEAARKLFQYLKMNGFLRM